jgi:hypothetical protein
MSEHDWGIISKGAIPGTIGVVLTFANITSGWKWVLTIACMVAAYGIVYVYSKKKADLFTAVALVFAAALVMHFLTQAGIV